VIDHTKVLIPANTVKAVRLPCAKRVDLILHQQGLDTSTPSGRAMFQMMGVFAEFERAMIRERVLAGLARVKEQGINLVVGD
jgi:DNA invertase Pin-like site-specific DNA recombinase